MSKELKPINPEHIAKASSKNLPISTKHSVEISRYLRYKTTVEAKKILEEVEALKRAVPFKRFKHNMGHKPGMASGRFPQKAAREFLKLVKLVEANAAQNGLNPTSLKIIKILANKAPVPLSGNRKHHGTKRTHLEIEVREKNIKPSTKANAEKSHTDRGRKTLKTLNAVKNPAKKQQVEGETS